MNVRSVGSSALSPKRMEPDVGRCWSERDASPTWILSRSARNTASSRTRHLPPRRVPGKPPLERDEARLKSGDSQRERSLIPYVRGRTEERGMSRPISMDLRERAMARLDRGETVRQVAAALLGGAVERGEVEPAAAADRERGGREDGRARAAEDPRRACGLAARADRGGAVHAARPGGRARRARAHGRLPHDVEVRARRAAQLQKKPRWRRSGSGLTSPGAAAAGSATRPRSTRSGWSSSTRPGRRPTWRRCRGWAPVGRAAAGDGTLPQRRDPDLPRRAAL